MQVNELELRVFGLMRSGNHAIMDWMLSLHPNEKICVLNNVEHGGADPYTACRQMEHFGFEPDVTVEEIRHAPKRLLIYSYEDRKHLQAAGTDFLSSVFDPAFEARREEYLGVSRKQRNILIIRDPFNCFASRMMQIRERGAKGDMNDLKQIADNWKVVARRALDKDPTNDDLVILYNHWVGNKSYRTKLAANLEGRYSEDSVHSEARHAGGSISGESGRRNKEPGRLRRSFQRMKLRLQNTWAWVTRSKMPVVDNSNDVYQRWRILRKDEQFRELFKDREILELSQALFGDIPGTRMYAERLSAVTDTDQSTAGQAHLRKATS